MRHRDLLREDSITVDGEPLESPAVQEWLKDSVVRTVVYHQTHRDNVDSIHANGFA